MERYTTMYHCGQPGLSDNPVTAYVNSLCATGATSDPATTWRIKATR
jgi:hypothetical protein